MRHEVIGAGSDSGNTIIVSANCDDISVTICWIGRTTYDGECDDLYRDERLCTVITLDPVEPKEKIPDYTGEYTWEIDGERIGVFYTVRRSCPPLPPTTCDPFCDIVELYTVPSKVPEKYDLPIDIHYKYFVTCERDDYVESRKKHIGVKPVSLSDFNEDGKCYTFKTDEGCERQVCLGDRKDPCAMGTDLYISVSLSKTVIPPNLSDEEGKPVFDDDWKMLPFDECFDEDKHPTPIPEDPFKQLVDDAIQCYDKAENPRYKENEQHELIADEEGYAIPITYYTVYISVIYKLIETDENCNKITETGMLKYPWHIPPCVNKCVITGKANGVELPKVVDEQGVESIVVRGSGEVTFSIGTQKPTPDTHPCCFDREISGETSIESLIQELVSKKKIGSGDDIKLVYYNGIKKDRNSNITYTVNMQAKKDGECSGVCRQTDKYGVVSGTTKVYYETQYMSDKWVSEDTPTCDCNALTLYDKDSGYVDSPYSVPFYGGRIKVEWDYVRHSVSDECDEYYTYGTWEEIIMIGGCDERPTDCNVCNGHGSSQGEPVEGCDCDALQIFDNECKVCDAECCYDDFGGKCSLLFKEQFPEFWDDMLMCDNGKSKLTIYKCKHCGALTPVMTDECDKLPKDECPSCERVEEGILEPIVFDMSHEYIESPIYECSICHAKLQSPGIDENCEYIPPDKCPFCGQEWSYDESNPNSGVTSDWYNKVKYAFNQNCNKSCDYRKYETYDEHDIVEIPCSGGHYQEDIEYTETIEFIGEGCPENIVTRKIEKIDIEVEPNPNTFGRSIRSDKAITIIQKGCEEEKDDCGCGFLKLEQK